MANIDKPNGACPKGEPLRCNEYTAGGEIGIGDLVKFNSSGQVIALAASTDAACGVAASYASASGVKVQVWDHPDQLFLMQSDDSTIDALTDINLNYEVVVGAVASRHSIMEIDGSTGATTATLPLKVLGLSPEAKNAYGANARCVCKINNHQLASHTGTAGV